jgi:hypothetical protein
VDITAGSLPASFTTRSEHAPGFTPASLWSKVNYRPCVSDFEENIARLSTMLPQTIQRMHYQAEIHPYTINYDFAGAKYTG